ncbi:MAG TPA: tripartite tricarboxylate transporter substrate binding protein [Hyphomicrobiaceae bacterium]|nr:tripartite tricarboxylate transporter substrate binding protein [Hyphomicrobiaceae bacterium]
MPRHASIWRSLRPAALVAAIAVMVSLAAALRVPAQEKWPTKPITIVMGFPAGSGVDVIARLLQSSMEKQLGTTLVFDYKVGAGGNNASALVAKAAPDGYTILLGTSATHGVNAALYKRLPFDVEADFTPIAPLNDVSNVLTINPKVIDAKNIPEFIAKVKAMPGKLNFASTGNGTGTHLAFATFVKAAGLDMVHIPYKGGPEALQSVVTGETCCIMNQVQTVLGQVKAGKVRMLGVTTAKRVAAVPDVPTIDESGVKGYESFIWFGLFGPKGLDPAIAEKINAAVRTSLANPDIQKRMAELGNTPRSESVAEFRVTVKADRAKWAEVVKASGASID